MKIFKSCRCPWHAGPDTTPVGDSCPRALIELIYAVRISSTRDDHNTIARSRLRQRAPREES